MFFKIICGFVKLCFVTVPVKYFFVKPLQLISIKLLFAINIYRQKGKKLQKKFNYGLAGIWFIFTKEKYFETVILKLNCTFQTSSMVSTLSKYRLFKKNINFFTPGFSQNYYISQENKVITCSLFYMTFVTPRSKLFQLFPTGSKNL